jgi:signal transduction histidine kinase
MNVSGNSKKGSGKTTANFTRRIGLSLQFSLVVLMILVISAFIVFGLSFLLGIPRPGSVESLRTFIVEILIACVLTGTVVSLAIGDFPLRPIRKIIDGIDQLAKGRFDTRLSLLHPREFKLLSDSFNRMAAELQGVEMLRGDFVDNFSHEFKTPISSIKGFAEQLRYDDLTDEERRDCLDIIIKESDRLAKLSTDILELSKLEAQTIPISTKTFDLAEQIRRCILLFEGRWEEKKLAIDVELEECEYTGDEDMLAQVWVNLLDNAVKFTPKGGQIHVSLRTSDGSMVFMVSDTGIGMDEQTMGHAFDRFYQGDASHATKGNGIGLPLVRRIVELYRGTIVLRSSPDQGTTATIRLPLEFPT